MSESATASAPTIERPAPAPVEAGRDGPPGSTAKSPAGPTPADRDPLADLLDKFEKIAGVLGTKEPGIAAGLNRLVEQAAEPGRAEQPLYRTQVAYMLQDVEKLIGAKITSVPAELRTELTNLAGTSPGLENKRMEALVRGTAELGDRGVIRDIRRRAASIAQLGDQQNSTQVQDMVDVLENRFRLATRFSGAPSSDPALTPRTAAPEAVAPATANPSNGPPSERVRATPSPGDGSGVGQVGRKIEPVVPGLEEGRAGQAAVSTQTASKPKHLMSAIMDGLRAPGGSPPPWEPPPAAMTSRVLAFEQKLADGRTDRHIRAAEKSGQALIQSMETFMNGPGAGVLGKIEAAASTEPGGMRTVMSEMQPGGRYAHLRSEFDNALQQDRVFAASFNSVEKAALQYGNDRLTLGADFQARKMDASQLEARFDRADAAIAAAAEKVPGRSPGQSIMDEVAEKVSELLAKAAERVRRIFAKAPDAGPRQGSSPSMTI